MKIFHNFILFDIALNHIYIKYLMARDIILSINSARDNIDSLWNYHDLKLYGILDDSI